MKSVKSYKEQLATLDEQLAVLQRDDVDLEDAIAAYEKGMKIVVELERYLKTAENKVVKLQKRFDEPSDKSIADAS